MHTEQPPVFTTDILVMSNHLASAEEQLKSNIVVDLPIIQ
jgi:hypothetical protein